MTDAQMALLSSLEVNEQNLVHFHVIHVKVSRDWREKFWVQVESLGIAGSI